MQGKIYIIGQTDRTVNFIQKSEKSDQENATINNLLTLYHQLRIYSKHCIPLIGLFTSHLPHDPYNIHYIHIVHIVHIGFTAISTT